MLNSDPQLNIKLKAGERSIVWRKAHIFRSYVEYTNLFSNVLVVVITSVVRVRLCCYRRITIKSDDGVRVASVVGGSAFLYLCVGLRSLAPHCRRQAATLL